MYSVKVLLDGVDITSKVTRFQITEDMESYCRELTLELSDLSLYDTLDFSIITKTPRIEVQTDTGSGLVSQGTFFIERPTFKVGIHSTETALWGRSKTALLGEPFAIKISRTWDTDTSFFRICEEIIPLCGLVWSAANSDIEDFLVRAGSYTADGLYPIEIMSSILKLGYGDDAFVSTNPAGDILITRVDRTPEVADLVISDPVLSDVMEEPEIPEFGNRIKIIAVGSSAGYRLDLTIPETCLLNSTAAQTKAYARVADQNGDPVNGLPISWASVFGLTTLGMSISTTGSALITGEEVRASSFYSVKLNFPPASIRGIYAYKDTGKTHNFASGGYTVDGSEVTLTSPFNYCDQLVRVDYYVDGVALNTVHAKTTVGTDEIKVTVSGNSDSAEVYIGNPCRCPPRITLEILKPEILIDEKTSCLVYAEMGGAPISDGRSVYMTIDTKPKHGKLQWTQNNLKVVEIENEEATVKNDIEGVSQIELNKFPFSVTGVWRFTEDAETGELTHTGSNLYSSHSGKTINLNTLLTSETPVCVTYKAQGAVVNYFTGIALGTDRLRAILKVAREEPVDDSGDVTVVSETDDDPDAPDDCCDPGLCVEGELACGSTADDEGGSGKVLCKVDGSLICADPGDCDSAEGGNVWGQKGGTVGQYPVGELDACGGEQRYYGQKDHQDGCWLESELDICGVGLGQGHMCYVQGQLTCVDDVTKCDTGQKGETTECGSGTLCCKNKTDGIMGCYPASECETTDDDPDDKQKKDEDKIVNCTKDDGTTEKCAPPKKCCISKETNKKGCFESSKCSDGGGAACISQYCGDEGFQADCLQGRFSYALSTNAETEPCDCQTICENEFSKYGTTQNYSGARSIDEIMSQDYSSLTPGSEEYNNQYETLKQEAMSSCLEQCEDCGTAGELTVAGSSSVTSPGGYQYTAAGGFDPYSWSIEGASASGISIDENGYVTVGTASGCKFTVVCIDKCGQRATVDVIVSNRGSWNYGEGTHWCKSQGACPEGNYCIIGFVKHSWGCGCESGRVPANPCTDNCEGNACGYAGYLCNACNYSYSTWNCY
jgi:hypothetical protein